MPKPVPDYRDAVLRHAPGIAAELKSRHGPVRSDVASCPEMQDIRSMAMDAVADACDRFAGLGLPRPSSRAMLSAYTDLIEEVKRLRPTE